MVPPKDIAGSACVSGILICQELQHNDEDLEAVFEWPRRHDNTKSKNDFFFH
jgi:hypothetical protein